MHRFFVFLVVCRSVGQPELTDPLVNGMWLLTLITFNKRLVAPSHKEKDCFVLSCSRVIGSVFVKKSIVLISKMYKTRIMMIFRPIFKPFFIGRQVVNICDGPSWKMEPMTSYGANDDGARNSAAE